MITPALIILLDVDLIIIPSYIIYSLGIQWAWQFNLIFIPLNHNLFALSLYSDHYIISIKNKVQDHLYYIPSSFNSLPINIYCFKTERIEYFYRIVYHYLISYYFPLQYQPINYLFDIFQYILLSIYSFIRLIVSSFDVIHNIGFYSLGIKIDAIPGKINSTTTLRLLNKGEYRGKCFELCGQGHLLMMSSTIIYLINIFILV